MNNILKEKLFKLIIKIHEILTELDQKNIEEIKKYNEKTNDKTTKELINYYVKIRSTKNYKK